jgi:hypothetical protein
MSPGSPAEVASRQTLVAFHIKAMITVQLAKLVFGIERQTHQRTGVAQMNMI